VPVMRSHSMRSRLTHLSLPERAAFCSLPSKYDPGGTPPPLSSESQPLINSLFFPFYFPRVMMQPIAWASFYIILASAPAGEGCILPLRGVPDPSLFPTIAYPQDLARQSLVSSLLPLRLDVSEIDRLSLSRLFP